MAYEVQYFGLSNQRIGKLGNRSKSWGSMMNKQAVAAGYLLAKHKHLDLGEVVPRKGLRRELALAYPDVANQFTLIKSGLKVKIRAQVHVELTSGLISSRKPRVTK